MKEQELRELDAWIAEHVMGYRRRKTERRDEIELPTIDGKKWCGLSLISGYTTDPAAAMMVLEKCLKSNRNHGGIVIYDSQVSPVPCYTIAAQAIGSLRVQAETLPLAICLFAKQLFAKLRDAGESGVEQH